MNNDRLLQFVSLLAIGLATLHFADDVIHGYEPVGTKNLRGIGVLVVWSTAALLMTGTRIGYLLLGVGSALAIVIPVTHFSGRGVERVIEAPGGLLFVWTLIALGVLGGVSMILTLRGAWQLGQSRRSAPAGTTEAVPVNPARSTDRS